MKGLIAFLLVLIAAELGYLIYDRETQKRKGSTPTSAPIATTSAPTPPAEVPALSPVLLNQLQELYKSGNQFSQAIKTGVSLSVFTDHSVKLRGQISTIQKLWPESYEPDTQTLLKKLDGSLNVTGEVWQADIDAKRRNGKEQSTHITGTSHGLLLLKAMALVHQNPYGLKMSFEGKDRNIVTSGEPLGGEILREVNNDKLSWVISYTDTDGDKHSDLQMLLTLCDGYYGTLEGRILPLMK